MTYNFDPDRWYEDELAGLDLKRREGGLTAEEYQAAVKYRHASSEGRLLAIEGVADTEAPDDRVVKAGEA